MPLPPSRQDDIHVATSRPQKIIAGVLLTLTVAALGATLYTWSWGNAHERLRTIGLAARANGSAVDTRPLDAAQQLAQLAETRTEKSYAAEALRLGDYAVDFAFAAAIRQAASAAVPSTPETLEIATHLKSAGAAVAADSSRIADLTQQRSRAAGAARSDRQPQLDLAQAQLELDRDDVEDARQDLIRAGGDRLASLQRLRDQHDTSLHAAAASGTAAAAVAAPSIELTTSSSIADLVGAWLSLNAKGKLLQQTRQSAVDVAARFADAHDTLEKQVAAEKAQQQILHQKGHNAGNATLARTAGDTKRGAKNADSGATGTTALRGPGTALSFLQELTVDQKDLSELDKRIENQQDLATLYGDWITYVAVRQQSFLHGIFQSVFWILLIVLLIAGANEGAQRVFSDVALKHRQLHTLRTVLLFGVQALGLVLILLLLFGMPSNFATLIALVGAGLALALQDFILGFFGWFILMGRDGIRPGDWVEINGVGGEVLEVGVFQTILLETSEWSESAHPTGRKVSFGNSFAIQGHYFNFSTSGQWLWDQVELQVPDGTDPFAVAEEIQRLAVTATAANAEAAEQDWQRVVPAQVRQTFSAVPSVTVRPIGGGVNVLVRYLTRASERQEIRARIYRAMIELLHGKSTAGSASVLPEQRDQVDHAIGGER